MQHVAFQNGRNVIQAMVEAAERAGFAFRHLNAAQVGPIASVTTETVGLADEADEFLHAWADRRPVRITEDARALPTTDVICAYVPQIVDETGFTSGLSLGLSIAAIQCSDGLTIVEASLVGSLTWMKFGLSSPAAAVKLQRHFDLWGIEATRYSFASFGLAG